MKRPAIIIISGVCALLIILACVFLFTTDIKVVNKLPLYFSEREWPDEESEWPSDYYNSDVIETPQDAVKIAKEVLKSVYKESSFSHRTFFVYYDEEKEKYFIAAPGFLLHAEAYIVVDKNAGYVAYIHTKF